VDLTGNDDQTSSIIEDYPITPGTENKLTRSIEHQDISVGDQASSYVHRDTGDRTLNQQGLRSYLSERAHGPLTNFEERLVNRWGEQALYAAIESSVGESVFPSGKWVLTPL